MNDPIQITHEDFKAVVAQALAAKEMAILERDIVILKLRQRNEELELAANRKPVEATSFTNRVIENVKESIAESA